MINIIDKYEKSIFMSGVGEDAWLAMYDLYENAWFQFWKLSKPSITHIKNYKDMVVKDGQKIVLITDGYRFSRNREMFFYNLGFSSEFKDIPSYQGRYEFLEGYYEVFAGYDDDTIESILSYSNKKQPPSNRRDLIRRLV